MVLIKPICLICLGNYIPLYTTIQYYSYTINFIRYWIVIKIKRGGIRSSPIFGGGGKLILRVFATVGKTVHWLQRRAYKKLDKQRYNHSIVYHKKGAYVIGKTSTNTIEGFWGHLKRVLKSTYHWVSPKHLQGYVDAETFRYNTKHLSDCKRFDVFLQNVYHTFTYKDLIAS